MTNSKMIVGILLGTAAVAGLTVFLSSSKGDKTKKKLYGLASRIADTVIDRAAEMIAGKQEAGSTANQS